MKFPALLAAACLAAASPALAQPAFGSRTEASVSGEITAAQRRSLVAAVLREVQKDYVFPEKVPAIVAAVRASERAGAYALSDSNALAARITEDLRKASGDGHLYLRWSPEQFAGLTKGEGKGESAEYWRAVAHRMHEGITELRVLPGNVRYMKVSAFFWTEGGVTARAYDDAVRFLKDGEAVVIDLRGNGGGDALGVRYLVSHFVEPGKLLITFLEGGKPPEESRALADMPSGRLTGKPLYVLIDKRCGSACEDFAYAVQQFRLGTLIGATTAGAANNNRLAPIAPGFVVSVSNGRPVHPVSGANWESVGVAPDVAIEPAQALDEALTRARQKPPSQAG